MKRIIALLLAAALFASVSLAESTAQSGDARRTLTYFWFIRGGYLPPESYEITEADGTFILTRDDGASAPIGLSVTDDLLDIIEDYGLFSWDGFDESDPFALDGEGFTLIATFSDGMSLSASGENAFPDHYFDAAEAITRLLDTALDGDAAGTYRYEEAGFGGNFTITLREDGTYTFYEGEFSSYIGGGHWYAERKHLYLSEENGFEGQFYFLREAGVLSYMKTYSDPFLYVNVPDEGKFIRMESPEENETLVGCGVEIGDISEFYYTVDASTDPPHYQRYHFHAENGAYRFDHETREGGGWPQTEKDITASGSLELTEAEWREFFSLISGGTVKNREENLDSGDAGPWMYLYWSGDQGTCQEYSFADHGTAMAFEAFCEGLAARGEGDGGV